MKTLTLIADSPVVFSDVDWPTVIGLIVAVILPLLVGLVTTKVTNSSTRAILLAILAAVTGLFTELGNAMAAGEPYNLGMGLVFAVAAFLVAVGMHFGLYKPTGASAAAQGVLVKAKE